MMPSEYMGKTRESFDWTLYRDDIKMQKRTVDAFVEQFANSKSLVEDFIFIQNVKDQARHFWRVFWQMRSRQDARSR